MSSWFLYLFKLFLINEPVIHIVKYDYVQGRKLTSVQIYLITSTEAYYFATSALVE